MSEQSMKVVRHSPYCTSQLIAISRNVSINNDLRNSLYPIIPHPIMELTMAQRVARSVYSDPSDRFEWSGTNVCGQCLYIGGLECWEVLFRICTYPLPFVRFVCLCLFLLFIRFAFWVIGFSLLSDGVMMTGWSWRRRLDWHIQNATCIVFLVRLSVITVIVSVVETSLRWRCWNIGCEWVMLVQLAAAQNAISYWGRVNRHRVYLQISKILRDV